MLEIRNQLLKDEQIDVYQYLLDFMRNPSNATFHDLLDKSPKKWQDSLQQFGSQILDIQNTDKFAFNQRITLGQVVIWQEILIAYRSIRKLGESIEHATIYPDCTKYAQLLSELTSFLGLYADMQAVLTRLESTLGVDRFLDRVGDGTFDILNQTINKYKRMVEARCESYKFAFQKQWNTTQVFNVISHKLLKKNLDNPICDMVCGDQQQVILLLVDGFGYCQYLWHKRIDSDRQSFSFKENIFQWLADNGFAKELMLGSPYVSDTGAGLAQILTGRTSRETAILASKVYQRNRNLNFHATKTMNSNDFDQMFHAHYNSIIDILLAFDKPAEVYYCSRYSTPVSGFSRFLYRFAEVKEIIPSERVFSVLESDIDLGHTTGLQLVYLTNIDNSGHTMGAYSGFEKYEHQKLNALFRNFLIELGINHPELFDGKRSIMMTADHGMYESSKKIVNRHQLTQLLRINGFQNFNMVENNRAMFLYLEESSQIGRIVCILRDYFQENQLEVDVTNLADVEYNVCFADCDDVKQQLIAPDVVMRFIGAGLFYTNPHINNHLLHFGGHGGYSIDEVFVPLIDICLDAKLLDALKRRFMSRL